MAYDEILKNFLLNTCYINLVHCQSSLVLY